ncbi:MAG: porin family protein [Granulosicoccus sp.]
MKKQLQLLLLASFALPYPHVHANSSGGFYVGTDYSYGNFDITGEADGVNDGFNIESNPSAASFTVGTNITTNLALEARMGIGISDDSVTLSSGDVSVRLDEFTVDVDRYYGLYAKYFVSINDALSFYGTAGYTEVELTLGGPDGSIEDDDDDFSLGFGGTYSLNQQLSVNAEFISLVRSSDEDDIEASVGAFNIGLKYFL